MTGHRTGTLLRVQFKGGGAVISGRLFVDLGRP
jgi:hypothetical protein